MAAGGELIIDDKLVRAIHDMEKALQGVAKEADATQRKTMAWLNSLNSGNIDAFTNKIKQLESNYMNFANALSNVKGFENISEKALNTAGAITQLITVIGQNTPKKTDGFDSIRQTLDSLLAQLAKARQDIDLYYQAIGTGKKEYVEFGQTGLKEAEARAESLMRKIEALNTTYQQLKQSSFNITDLTKGTMDDERSRNELEGIKARLMAEERLREESKRNEKKAQDDIRHYERQKQDESLAKYKQQKEEQARVDKHYHDKRQREYDEMFKAIERNENRQRAINAKYGDSSKGALNYSNRLYSTNGVRSIQNMETALNKLRDAQRRLNVGTEEGRKRYAELGAQIKKIEGDLNRVTNASERMKKSHSGLINTGQQLARQLALVFSVSQIEGYVNKLVSVRKEFELQQRSLQALLQNKQAANEIWNQTVQLALKSPFRVKDLVTYTKELAAYRIETGKLHDTTKMLADVSAGLGVDMSRLILAFGQVRAAEFLRGTELRQFTEAGIPMLEELANHFSTLEGRAVSTADVFERISKRMVVFADVEAVFEKLTSAGGAFYKMQEKQSETLYGSISNLHDAIDIMLNDIGKSHDGLIKGSVAFARKMVDNWKTLATVIKVAAGALALYKLNAILTSKALIRMAVATNITTASNVKCLSVTQLLRLSFVRLGKSISAAGKAMKTFLLANPIAASIMAVVAALIELNNVINDHEEQLEEIDKRYRELKEQVSEIHVNFIYSDNIEDRREELAKLIEFANNELGMRIDVKASEVEESKVESEFYRIQGLVLDTQAALTEWEKKWAEATHWTAFDDLFENIETLDKYLNRNSSILINNRARLVEYLKQLGLLSVEAKKALEPLREGESQYEYAARLSKAFDMAKKEIIGLKGNLHDADEDIYNIFTDLNKDLSMWTPYQWNVTRTAKKQFLKAVEEMRQDLERLTPEERGVRITALIDKMATEKEWSSFVQGELKQWFTEIPELPITFTAKLPSEKSIDPWKVRVTAAVQKLNERIQKELGANAPKTLFPVPTENDSLESWLNRYKEAIEEAKTVFIDGQEIFDADDVKDKNALKPYTREAEIIANITDKTTKNEKDANAILNKRISLIKEIHSAYEKERKLWDESTSEERVLQSYMLAYEDAFGKRISGYNFKIKESVAAELQELTPLAEKAGKEAIIALERAIASTKVESGDLKKKLADEDLIRQVEDMFGTYELSLELKDMNIPTDIAEKLFGFESLDLEGLKEELKKLKPQFIGTDQEKEYRDYLQKVEKMEAKALEERMKKYAKFLEQEQTERVKIKLNEVRQLMEIEDTFRIHEKDAKDEKKFAMTDEQWKAYEKQRKQGKAITDEFLKRIGLSDKQTEAIIQQNKLLTEQANIARKGVTRVTEEDLDKNAWEEFKKSPYYETLFADMEHSGTKSLRNLRDKIDDMKKSLKTLPPEIYKQVVEAIDKVDAQLTARNPFRTIFEAWGELRRISKEGVEITKIDAYGRETKARVQSRKDIAKELSTEQTLLETKREEASVIQQILQADTKTRQILADKNQIALKVLQTTNGNNDALAKELNTTKKVVAVHEENVEKLGREEAKYRSIEAKMDGAKKGIQEWANATTDLIGSVDSLLDSLGLAEDSQTRIWLKASMGIVDTIASVAQLIIQFTLMEVAANSALGIIGYIATALKAIATLFATLFGNPDEGLQKQIEALEVSVEALDRKFQKLEKSIKNAMGVDDINRFTDDAIQNLEDQNKAIGEMIALEEAKKGTDADKIRDWANEMEDNIEEMERLRNERIKELGGIGGAEEIKSAAEEFTDAWLQAFLETGDGLVGLEDKFNDFARNLIKSQLMHRVVESLITPLTTKINEIVDPQNEGGGDITDKEWQELMLLWDRQKEVINERLSSLIEELGGIDSLSSNRDLEGLQKGVQSIQESTAQEIVSYMNSLRALVTQRETFYKNNEQLSSLLDNILTNGINPMLEQMRVIANNTESIHTLLDSVVKAGHREGGYGIKVFSD